MKITARMKAAREAACLTVSDMALWFGVSRAAMSSWIVGEHEPFPGTSCQLEPLLVLLEKTIKRRETKNLLPVPLHIRQYKRKEYLSGVKARAITKFSKSYTVSVRTKVSRKNK